ncbi:MAG TPA: CHAD domain-containing protein [Gaiellaceae bacterium]|jgi:CHAD domain-containing protein|nr:CHAD domain-containing protein [Gaiellaceae bacterium]
MAASIDSNGSASTATYHDTPDRRLARAGISLRRRMVNGVGVWEAEVAGKLLSEPGGPAQLPPELAQRLRAPLRDGELVEIARLREGTGDVALLEGQHVMRTYTDLGHALDDALEPPRLQGPAKGAPAIEYVRAYLQRQLAEIERTDPIVRSANDDEALHDFRVAVRRSRAVLRAARQLFEREWLASLRAELKWLGGELAPLRDLDVLLAHVREGADGDVAPVVKALVAERRRVRRKLTKALASARYFALLDELAAAADHPPVQHADVSLRKLAADEFGRLRRRFAALGPHPTDDALHRSRIAAKRARYAAELAEPIVGKRARKFVAAAKAFQDVVGAHQDAVTAAARVRAIGAGSADTATTFAAGRLVERQEGRRATARAAVPKAWRRLERRGRKAWC